MPLHAVAAERGSDERRVERQPQPRAASRRGACVACRATNGTSGLLAAARAAGGNVSKPPCIGSRHAAVGQRGRRAESPESRSGAPAQMLAVALVDPVPGEIRDDDRRNAAVAAAAQPSGGASATTQPDAVARGAAPLPPRRAHRASRRTRAACAMVAAASRWRLSIWTTPVSHGRASSSNGTRRVRSSSQRAAESARQIPASEPPAREGVDDLDLPRGMTETVAADVEATTELGDPAAAAAAGPAWRRSRPAPRRRRESRP